MEVQTKKCYKCGIVKSVDNFGKDRSQKDGLKRWCRSCRSNYDKPNPEYSREYSKKYYKENTERCRKNMKKYYNENVEHMKECRRKHYDENKERYRELNKKWNEENKERRKEYDKKWREGNPDKVAARNANRKAMKQALPHINTSDEWLSVLEEFDGECPVTGSIKVDLEHGIPLSWGWGGSLANNIYPLESSLNRSKNAKNPFEFMEELTPAQQAKYRKVLHKLAEKNGLTYKEYKKFVNWCEQNKRTVEQIEEDNKLGLSEVELWKIRANISN